MKKQNKILFKHDTSNFKEAVWWNPKMRFRFLSLLLWTLGLEKSKDYEVLVERINDFIKINRTRKNDRMSFEYLKDCYLIMQHARIGKSYTDLKHNVAIREGYPKIIPWRLRATIKTCGLSFIAVHTLFGIHRIIPWWPKIDFSTITDTFDGVSETLSPWLLEKGLRNFLGTKGKRIKRLRLEPPRFLKLLSASPNGGVSLYTSVLDAAAYHSYPSYIIPLIKWNWYNKGHLVNLSFITLLILTFPFYLNKSLGRLNKIAPVVTLGPLSLGRLKTITDVAGKTRIIALANYWLQVSLKPLHDAINLTLKECPNDGTYDQMKPVNILPMNKIYSSFDLSAATDRLPLMIQRDILSFLIGKRRADLWRDCISIPFNTEGDDFTIKYAVGQPMGAYSSFAMLALTHHVIICSLYNKSDQRNYAVLGDDMAIEESKAEEYQHLIKTLGVKISIGKSLLNSECIEFCKRIIDKTTNEIWQIISPKLLIKGCQGPYYRAILLLDSFKRGFLTEMDVVFKLGSVTFGLKGLPLQFGLHLMFGPGGQVREDDYLALDESGWIEDPLSDSRGSDHEFSVRASYAQEILRDWMKQRSDAIAILLRYLNWSKGNLYEFCPSLRFNSEIFLFFMSPGFWLPLWSYIKMIFEQNPLMSIVNDDDINEFHKLLGSGFDSNFLIPSKESVKISARAVARFNINYNKFNVIFRLHYKWREEYIDNSYWRYQFNYPKLHKSTRENIS